MLFSYPKDASSSTEELNKANEKENDSAEIK